MTDVMDEVLGVAIEMPCSCSRWHRVLNWLRHDQHRVDMVWFPAAEGDPLDQDTIQVVWDASGLFHIVGGPPP